MAETERERTLLDGDVRIEPRDGYLFVWHRRAAENLAELEHILSELDVALEADDLTAIMFDSRQANYTEGEVQSRMWSWLEGHPRLRQVATLVESPRLAVSVQMTGMSRRVKIRAFHDESEGEAWLRGAR